MKTHWCEDRIAYDGSQLRAHWVLSRFALVGDAMVGFRGPCAVTRAEMADLADLDGPGIAGNDMVHFVWECFTTTDLLLAVHRQRLLAAQAMEVLSEQASPAREQASPAREQASPARLRRVGDDLWLGPGKLSISIATVTPISALIHFAVNAAPGGAPVAIATLQDLDVDAKLFATALLARVASEEADIAAARAKVRAKGEWR